MGRRYSRFLGFILFTGDIVLLNFSFLLALFLHFGNLKQLSFVNNDIGDNRYFQLLIITNLFWFLLVTINRLYKIDRIDPFEKIAFSLFKTLFFQVVLVFAYITTVKGHTYSREQLLFTYLVFTIMLLGWRFLMLKFIEYYRRAGFNYRRIIVIGAGDAGRAFVKQLRTHQEYGYKFMGFFDDKYPEINSEVLGKVADAQQFALENDVDEIYCALPSSAEEKITDLSNYCDKNLIRFKLVPDLGKFLHKQYRKIDIDYYGEMPVFNFRKEPLELITSRIIKRVFDVAFSLFVLIFIFSWLFPLISLLIKLTSKGPVLFKQQRSGEKNKIFTCYKFRTMRVNDEADSRQATAGDSRVTPIGRFLRRTNLDELPQFINVLIGNMSVVGPRPHMLRHTEEYSQIIDKYMVRHFTKPGISGWAQVNGYRGETLNPRLMEKRVQYDVWYIENWSFFLDLKVIFLTITNMLRGEKNAV